MQENVLFDCVLDQTVETSKIKNLLPEWKTKIQEIVPLKNSNMYIKCSIAATTVEEIKKWIRAYEEQTNSVYSVKSTEKSSGKYVSFKQRLYCHRNTRCSRTYEVHKKNKTRNTNCPASINITLRAIKKVYRGKDHTKAPNPEMPCEIILCPNHNHETDTADALRFQAVSAETKEKLLTFFKHGHTPASALESLKMDIVLNNNDYEEILANRKYCPNYDYCYYLYMTTQKKLIGDEPVTMEADENFTPSSSKSINNKLIKEEITRENLTAKNKTIVEEIAKTFLSFSEISPLQVGIALLKMKENLDKLKTISAFLTACMKFGSDLQRIHRRSKIPVQPTTIARRRTLLTSKATSVRGTPVKRAVVSSKKSQNSINKTKNTNS